MIEFGLKDFIDILLVAMILYYSYRLMRESKSINVFVGIIIFVALWVFVSQVLEMKLLGGILDKLVSVGVIAIIVIFQEDIRKFLYNLGARQSIRTLMSLFSQKHNEEPNSALRQSGNAGAAEFLRLIDAMQLDVRLSHKLLEITPTDVLVENVRTGERLRLPADTVLLAVGLKAKWDESNELRNAVEGTFGFLIGDCVNPGGNVKGATSGALSAAGYL